MGVIEPLTAVDIWAHVGDEHVSYTFIQKRVYCPLTVPISPVEAEEATVDREASWIEQLDIPATLYQRAREAL